jgi:DNA-binding Lrp family transcriptional regulator
MYITNPWVLGLVCFVFGVFIAVLFSLILSIPIKGKSIGSRTIDPSFHRIRFIKKEEVIYQLLAGFGNAILTIGYFMLLSFMKGDVSVVLPFTQMVILYLVIIESLSEKDTPTLVEIQSGIIVTFGAMLGSISFSGNLNLASFAIVFLVINPGWVLMSVYQRKLKLLKINDRPNDAINIRLWNVTIACAFTALIIYCYDLYAGTSYILDSITATLHNGFWVACIAVGTFFSFIFYIRALGIGKASVTQAVKATVIIFTIPVSIVLGVIGIIPPFTTDPVMLMIKFIGITMMLLGILSYALTLTKAYVFITIQPGFDIEHIMRQLWNIKGVSRVTAVAGHYDFIIKIRTRTLIKGYERILRKLETVQGIKKFKWQSVLKEWEDI